MKLTHFLLEVKTQKSETLSRAYKFLLESISQKSKDRDRLTGKEFSKCMASLENDMLRKYCLHSYFDGGTKTIEDFTVNFAKSLDKIDPEDLHAHFNQYEQLKKRRSERDLNIFNPEFVLGLSVENAIKQFQDGDLSRDQLHRIFSDILKGTYEVSNKIEKIQARNELLESAMLQLKKKEQENQSSDDSDDNDASNTGKQNLGSRTSMEIFSDLIRDCNKFFSQSRKNKKQGYLISFN